VTGETLVWLALSLIWSKAIWLSWMFCVPAPPLKIPLKIAVTLLPLSDGQTLALSFLAGARVSNVQVTVIVSWQQTWVPASAVGMETAKGPLVAGHPQLVVPTKPTLAVVDFVQ
jgi:hypothetical protein